MSNLRTKMTQDMIVRGLATSTQKAYLHAVTELSNYYSILKFFCLDSF